MTDHALLLPRPTNIIPCGFCPGPTKNTKSAAYISSRDEKAAKMANKREKKERGKKLYPTTEPKINLCEKSLCTL